MNLTKPKIAIGIIGTILLGVVSSAIWDGIKPLTKSAYEYTLYVSVLGAEKLKDGIYRDIAKGHHENASIEIYALINGVLIGLILSVLLVTSIVHMHENGNAVIAQKLKNIIQWPRHLSTRSFLVLVFLYAVFSVTVFSFNLVKTKYINEAVTYYKQLLTIVTPYVESSEIHHIESSFGQIKNRSDYELVIMNLHRIAEENNLVKPEFSFIF